MCAFHYNDNNAAQRLQLCDKEKVPRNNRLEQNRFQPLEEFDWVFRGEKAKTFLFFLSIKEEKRYKEATEFYSNFRILFRLVCKLTMKGK